MTGAAVAQVKAVKRTRPDDIDTISSSGKQALITAKTYENALSMNSSGNAYLEIISPDYAKNIEIRNGTLYLGDIPIAEDVVRRDAEPEILNTLNLSILRMLYTEMLKKFEESGYTRTRESITLYAPDFFESLGLKRNLGENQVRAMFAVVRRLESLMGIVLSERNGKVGKSFFKLLVLEEYDYKKNTFSFSSPYMSYIVRDMYEKSIKKDADGKIVRKQNGLPATKPTHSYLIHADIAKEKNLAAVENVNIIVSIIEQAGSHIKMHEDGEAFRDENGNVIRNGKILIKATTLIERNPYMSERLANADTRTRQQILDRAFSKTWELLRTKTDLEEMYPGIELPNENDPYNLPKYKNLYKAVFRIVHHGKKKRSSLPKGEYDTF